MWEPTYGGEALRQRKQGPCCDEPSQQKVACCMDVVWWRRRASCGRCILYNHALQLHSLPCQCQARQRSTHEAPSLKLSSELHQSGLSQSAQGCLLYLGDFGQRGSIVLESEPRVDSAT
eukprot:COSAG02_NODE_34111_length_489_cov_1.038462_1_plen_118_part_10